MRADRLLSILLLLQTHGKMTAPQLAEQLEVSVRSVYRDIEALSAAGVPVYAEQGRNGGITLVPGYRTDLTGLTASEAQALFVFTGRGAVEELGLGDDLRQAIRKLLATVPAAHRDDAARISQRVVVDPHSWRRTDEAQPHLATLQEAVLADRRVRIRYPSRTAKRDRDYELAPYGLVAKAGVWYLVGLTDAGVRTFRVSRVRAATVLAETFERPAGLDVEQLWAELQASFNERMKPSGYPVTVVIDADTVELFTRVNARWLTGPIEVTDEEHGGATARLELDGPVHASHVLLPFGPAVEVVEPRELRDHLVTRAEAIVARYRG
jgi:predicted DNA-binding transcriptional regulator YafY